MVLSWNLQGDIHCLVVTVKAYFNLNRSEMQLSLRTQAIKLLNQQVMQLTISHLVKSLMKWPFEMISAFLTEMANYMAEDLMNDFPQFPLLLRCVI